MPANNLLGERLFNLLEHTLSTQGVRDNHCRPQTQHSGVWIMVLYLIRLSGMELTWCEHSSRIHRRDTEQSWWCVVDGGKFDWKANADKYPSLANRIPVITVPCCRCGAATFVTPVYVRCSLRDTGAIFLPFNAWVLLHGDWRHSVCIVERHATTPKGGFLPTILRWKIEPPSLPSHRTSRCEKLFPNEGWLSSFER